MQMETPNTIPNFKLIEQLEKDLNKFFAKGGKIKDIPSQTVPKKPNTKVKDKVIHEYANNSKNLQLRMWVKQVIGRTQLLCEISKIRRYIIDQYILGDRYISDENMQKIRSAMFQIENMEKGLL